MVIIGAGHRSLAYAEYALEHPDRARVVAVAEPDPVRRKMAADLHQIPRERQFESCHELTARPKMAQAAINGTMDHLHHATTLQLLEAGYHILLEKPIAPCESEVVDLIRAARRHQRVIMVCHVLRYALFYQTIKQLLVDGKIGSIVAMHTSENVSYHHMAAAFIRGKWRRTEANPMLLAKCCHDLDIIAWMMQGNRARRVASFGSLMQFKPENAPPGSALRCLDGCRIESSCPYSARANYITQGLWGPYVWHSIEHIPNPTIEDKLHSLRTDNPFGRCVWHCDNDVVDHQTVAIEYENGATVTHNMLCATARPTRTIHVLGTGGEIEGDLSAGIIKIRIPHAVPGRGYDEELISGEQYSDSAKGHGGTDEKIVADFVNLIAGNPAALGATRIEDSLAGHQIAYAADEAMRCRRVVEIQQYDFTTISSTESDKIPCHNG